MQLQTLFSAWDAGLLLLTLLSSSSITSFPGLWPPTMWCVPWPINRSGLHESAVQPEVQAQGSLASAKHALIGWACMPGCVPGMCANTAKTLPQGMLFFMHGQIHVRTMACRFAQRPPACIAPRRTQGSTLWAAHVPSPDKSMRTTCQAYLSACFS